MNTNVREQRAWYVYDFANSAFASTVITLFLGPYLTSLAKAAAGADGMVHPFGIPVEPRSWWGYMVALSVMTQVVALPLMGTIADFSKNKKGLLAITRLYWSFRDCRDVLAARLGLFAGRRAVPDLRISRSGHRSLFTTRSCRRSPSRRSATTFPRRAGDLDISAEESCLPSISRLFSNAAKLGLTEGLAVRISLASAGLWWALFTLVPLRGLEESDRPDAFAAPAKGWDRDSGNCSRRFARCGDIRKHLTFLIAYSDLQRRRPSGDHAIGPVRQRTS